MDNRKSNGIPVSDGMDEQLEDMDVCAVSFTVRVGLVLFDAVINWVTQFG